MAYTSVTYADISSGTEVRRTEPKCPHISKLSKERLVGARKAPTSRLKRRHTAATRGTALSIEASRLDRATDRCSCKRSPRTAHSQTGVVANVHHARRTARPVELQTFTMHGAQPDRWACHAHPVSIAASGPRKSCAPLGRDDAAKATTLALLRTE